MRNLFYALILVVMPLVLPFMSQAQTTISSPYSRYGLGELKRGTYGQTASMGRATTALRDNKTINPFNPASFSAVDTLSFLFDLGLTGEFSSQSSPNFEETFKNSAFDHINIAFPINKNIGISLGVLPYSGTGFSTIINSQETAGSVTQAFNTTGGLSEFYLGGAIELGKGFSVGANMSYLFGEISNVSEVTIDATGYYNTISEQTLTIKDLNFNVGMQYTLNLSKENDLTLGFTYENKRKTNTEGEFIVLSIGNNFQDTIIHPNNQDLDYEIPARYSFGAALNLNKRLLLMADVSLQNWKETTITSIGEEFENNFSGHLGVQFTPDRTSLTNYFNLIRYRLGSFYDSGYMSLNGENLTNYGITFGLGLPIVNPKTSINLSCELGKRGTSNNNLVEESYAFFGINITFADIWFLKRKYQ